MNTYTHSLSLCHTHTHTHTHTESHSLSPSRHLSRFITHTDTHTQPHITITHAHMHKANLSHTDTNTFTYTHSLLLPLSLTHTHTQRHNVALVEALIPYRKRWKSQTILSTPKAMKNAWLFFKSKDSMFEDDYWIVRLLKRQCDNFYNILRTAFFYKSLKVIRDVCNYTI